MSTVTFGTGPFSEGQVYLGSNGVNYVYENGCFNLSKPADIDTVDGYSEQGVSDGSQLDAKGDPIPAGNDITTYYDSDGVEINSKDNSDEWSESITLASGDAYPTSPTLAGTCSKVLDSAGNLMGTVDDDGPHPIQHPNYITQTLCTPDGDKVIAKRDIDSLAVVYYLQDGSVYAGDISALEECPDLGISKRCSDGEEIVLGETSLVTGKEVELSRWVNPLPFPATVYAQHGSPEECGTSIVCGPGGLVGSPEHTAYCENIIVNASWNLLNESYADWQAANGGAALGQSGVIKYDDEMQSWTNPHRCRRVMVEIAHGWERWAVIQRAGTSGSIVKVLEVDGGNTIGINDANANNATESDEFQQIWGLGGQYAAPCVILEPGETVEFRHRVYWYWGAPTVSAIPTALVYGLSGAKVEYRIKAWTI